MERTSQRTEVSHNQSFKIVIVGDSKVGKTSLMTRYASDKFTDDYFPTSGVDTHIKIVILDNEEKVQLILWDAVGPRHFKTCLDAFYLGSDAFVLVFDVTDETSFHNVKSWFKKTRPHCHSNNFVVIVGNKCDDFSRRVVSYEECATMARELNLDYFEVSAKDSINVNAPFEVLTSALTGRICHCQEQARTPMTPHSSSLGTALDRSATDSEVLAAVGDPCTTVEYVEVILRLFFDLQEETAENQRLCRQQMGR